MAAHFSKLALEKLTEFEGNKLIAYWDDIGKIYTIGRGHTGSLAGLKLFTGDVHNLPAHFDMLEVYKDLKITEEQSLWLCETDLGHFIDAVDEFTDYGHYMTNNQYSALVIWAYNIGANAAENSSLASYIFDCIDNRVPPNSSLVATKLRAWNKSKGKVIQGLVNRREKEIALYNTPDDLTDITGAFPS